MHTTKTPLLLYSSTLLDSPITPFLPSISGGAPLQKCRKRRKRGPSPHPFCPSRNQTRRGSPLPPLFFLHYILQLRDRGRGKRGPVKCEIGPALLAIPPFFVDRPPSFSIPTTTYSRTPSRPTSAIFCPRERPPPLLLIDSIPFSDCHDDAFPPRLARAKSGQESLFFSNPRKTISLARLSLSQELKGKRRLPQNEKRNNPPPHTTTPPSFLGMGKQGRGG